jgi:formylglycine-generating enzyme required for sulfatase activity
MADDQPQKDSENDLHTFIQISPGPIEKVKYVFWITRYPVTNAQYARFLNAPDYATEKHWINFPKFNYACIENGDWGDRGWQWLQRHLDDKSKKPSCWHDATLGIANPNNLVVGVSWYEAAGGDKPEGRYPWNLLGQVTTNEYEISKRANVRGKVGRSTPVFAYPDGKSPLGVMDMAGNVQSWQANFSGNEFPGGKGLAERGGYWGLHQDGARVSYRNSLLPFVSFGGTGFRVVAFNK